jgi:hypothetical protein
VVNTGNYSLWQALFIQIRDETFSQVEGRLKWIPGAFSNGELFITCYPKRRQEIDRGNRRVAFRAAIPVGPLRWVHYPSRC